MQNLRLINTPELFRIYRQNPGLKLRNELVERHLDLVRKHARRLLKRLPISVQLDELYSAGIFGLLHAVEAYDPHRNIAFSTFSARHIRGAMLDELRSIDYLSRGDRLSEKRRNEIEDQLFVLSGIRPNDGEVTRAFHDRFGDKARLIRRPAVLPLGHTLHGQGDESSPMQLPDERSPSPFERLEQESIKQQFVRSLNRYERLVLVLYYYEDLTLDEIGGVLALSESRVSQIRTKILKDLRERLETRRPLAMVA